MIRAEDKVLRQLEVPYEAMVLRGYVLRYMYLWFYACIYMYMYVCISMCAHPHTHTPSHPHSSLSYEKSQTLFRVGQPPFSPVVREIPLSNQFDVSVVLYDVKLPSKAQEYFSVSCVCVGAWTVLYTHSLCVRILYIHLNIYPSHIESLYRCLHSKVPTSYQLRLSGIVPFPSSSFPPLQTVSSTPL